jgi:hypothetical protein
MNWILCLLMLFAALSGCASPYMISEQGLKYRSSLTESEALKAVEQNIQKNDEQAGLCSAHTNKQFQNATLIKVRGHYVEFESFYKEMMGSDSKMTAGQFTTTSYDTREGNFMINLKELSTIKVLSKVNAPGCTTYPFLGKYIVMIDMGAFDMSKARPSAVMINVSTKNLDRFLAALTFLSPQAKLIQGKRL